MTSAPTWVWAIPHPCGPSPRWRSPPTRPSRSRSASPTIPISSPTTPAIDGTVRERNHPYAPAAAEVVRHGIIRLETLGLPPDNPERSAFPHPGDKLQVRMDESNTTRYFIPVSREG